jgi:hypothetical protein
MEKESRVKIFKLFMFDFVVLLIDRNVQADRGCLYKESGLVL